MSRRLLGGRRKTAIVKAKKRLATRKKVAKRGKQRSKLSRKVSKRGKPSDQPSRKKAAKRGTPNKRPRKTVAKMAPRKPPRQKAAVVEDTIIDVIDEPVPGSSYYRVRDDYDDDSQAWRS